MIVNPNLLLTCAIIVVHLKDVICQKSTDPEVLHSLPKVNFALADAKESEVRFIYFSRTSRGGQQVTKNTVSKVVDKKLKTVLIIHGYTADTTEPWFPLLRDNYFKNGRYNIIYVDWSIPANRTYFVAFANIKPVSEFVGEFLMASRIPLQNIHLLGHSLGGQMSGLIGKYIIKKTNKKLNRITGLDPAAPMFEFARGIDMSEKLNYNDAEFVDVIHTNIKLYGYTSPIGHIDFYPNKGEYQPGCPEDYDGNLRCSHARAPEYFAESIVTKVEAQEAVVIPSALIEDIEVDVMSDGERVIFGQHVDNKARGVFYLETNSESPFLIRNIRDVQITNVPDKAVTKAFIHAICSVDDIPLRVARLCFQWKVIVPSR